MPKSAGNKSCQTCPKSRFPSFRSYAKIHIVPQPIVGIHIPIFKVCTSVLRCLDSPRIHILKSVPLDSTGLRVDAFISHTWENTGSFGKVPDTIIFQPSWKPKQLQNPHSPEKSVRWEMMTQDNFGIVPAREFQVQKYPDKTHGGFPRSRFSTAGDFPLLPSVWSGGLIRSRGYPKHAGFNPAPVIDVIKRWAGKQRREKELWGIRYCTTVFIETTLTTYPAKSSRPGSWGRARSCWNWTRSFDGNRPSCTFQQNAESYRVSVFKVIGFKIHTCSVTFITKTICAPATYLDNNWVPEVESLPVISTLPGALANWRFSWFADMWPIRKTKPIHGIKGPCT